MKRVALLALILIPFLMGCPQKSSPAPAKKQQPAAAEEAPTKTQKKTLRLGIAIPSYVHAVAWIGAQQGFFDQHGIEAEVVTMGGSAATMKGLVAGDIQIGLAGGDAAIKANLAGADLVVFGGVVTKHYHRLVVSGDINKPFDLKGKTIGLPFLGGPQDFLVYVLCKKWGLSYGKEVKVQNMGKEFARLVAITKNKVDGITSAAPRSKLDKLGLRILADPRTWDEPAPYMMMVARRPFLEENQALALDFMRALAQAQTFYLGQRDEALKVAFDKLGAKKGDAQENYRTGGPLMYDIPPLPKVKAMKLALDYIGRNEDFAKKAAGFDLQEMIDPSLAQKLVAEGAYEEALAAQKRLAASLAANPGEAGTCK